jgi:cell division protein ZapB
MPERSATIDSPPGDEGVFTHMMHDDDISALENELRRLEQRFDELLGVIHHLQEENRALRNRQEHLSTERATLLQKNEQVRTRVEAIIGRLRTMESGA